MSYGWPRPPSEYCESATLVLDHRSINAYLYIVAACSDSVLLDVRVRYENKDMALPLCAAEGSHLPGSPQFCALKTFQKRVKELTPEDWDVECSRVGDGL